MNIQKEDIITTDRYLEAFPQHYYKTDVICMDWESMKWREREIYPPKSGLPLLITGHSDYPITDTEVDKYRPKKWFCVNRQTERPNVFSLPLGITNHTSESELHPIYGDLDGMIQVMQEKVEVTSTLSIYMNMNVHTYPQERKYVFDLLKDRNYVTIGNPVNTIEGRIRYLREIKKHTFVVCPRGNGIDTHRLWETLYMGSIPIVRRDIAYMDFTDLPICFVDAWEEIDPAFLASEKERIYGQTWNYEKLKIGYWVDLIRTEISSSTSGRKVISFSLWGDKPIYTQGAIINAKDALHIYPGFECWFYIHADTVPKKIIDELREMEHVRIFLKTGDLAEIKPMMWRFLAIDHSEVEIMISRDTDTRFLQREKMAVEEWIQSGFSFHIMRDHPYHNTPMLGGMFGSRKHPSIPSWRKLIDRFLQTGDRDYDQYFLKMKIYPLIRENALIHASFYRIEEDAKYFPIDYDADYRFVGEYIYEDESRNVHHINDLKNALAGTYIFPV